MGTHHHHHNYGPTFEAAVVLDIGGDIGAVVVQTTPALAGHEIELAPEHHDVPLVHTAVRERHLPDRVVHAAVFPAVPAGTYTLIGTAGHRSRSVVVAGGHVTELTW
jgi:hypothetical protein